MWKWWDVKFYYHNFCGTVLNFNIWHCLVQLFLVFIVLFGWHVFIQKLNTRFSVFWVFLTTQLWLSIYFVSLTRSASLLENKDYLPIKCSFLSPQWMLCYTSVSAIPKTYDGGQRHPLREVSDSIQPNEKLRLLRNKPVLAYVGKETHLTVDVLDVSAAVSPEKVAFVVKDGKKLFITQSTKIL